MDLKKIPIGKNPPRDVNVVIEIPLRGDPVKYEICKESGAMFVDRFLNTAMYYPVNYGFVPHTLSEDGDPVDVMVVGRVPVAVGAVMRSRPIGVLLMEDEGGMDEKIEHFFVHYKDLEVGKWVQLKGWGGPEKAGAIIQESIDRAIAAKPKKK